MDKIESGRRSSNRPIESQLQGKPTASGSNSLRHKFCGFSNIMHANFKESAVIGMLIGFFGAIFGGVATALALIAYTVARPDEHIGSTAGMAICIGAALSAVFGAVAGSLAGLVAALLGMDLRGPIRCIVFAVFFMTMNQLIWLAWNSQAAPHQLWDRFALYILVDVLADGVGWVVAGALIGTFVNRLRPRTHDHIVELD